ncbi:hypothetical protein H4R18_002523 [Coemansia javaensis]|uniref:DHHA2 domain-containing protein n=1 Tax=Coemansia javaensis TaxID=2761396 RepID=A0A9W8LJ09_9FUNG|nr:hypothetical protein H4R18_002523 [Coemansia javaensis]
MRGFGAFVRALAGSAARLRAAATTADSSSGGGGGGGGGGGALTLVLGNESADLDSIVSSIALAYALGAGPSGVAAIPVINANRSDMVLRPDCTLLLDAVLAAEGARGVADLAFIDDFDPAAIAQRYSSSSAAQSPPPSTASSPSSGQAEENEHRLDIWLVDHNAPASRLAVLAPFVRGIVDHHVDEGQCPQAAWRQIATVGSCSTLVAERLRALPDAIDPPLAKMLLAPILIDTANLSPAAQRATDADIACAAWLAAMVDWTPQPARITANDGSDGDGEEEEGSAAPSLDVATADDLYRVLGRLKGAVSHLAAADLLRKDYKQWDIIAGASGRRWTVGISSVGYRLRKWLKRDGRVAIEAAIGDWVRRQRLDLALVMTHGKARDRKHGPKLYGRDLAVVFAPRLAADPLRRAAILDALARDETLGLHSYFAADSAPLADALAHFYTQTRAESSRKQVFPAVKAVIEAVG